MSSWTSDNLLILAWIYFVAAVLGLILFVAFWHIGDVTGMVLEGIIAVVFGVLSVLCWVGWRRQRRER